MVSVIGITMRSTGFYNRMDGIRMTRLHGSAGKTTQELTRHYVVGGGGNFPIVTTRQVRQLYLSLSWIVAICME